MRPTPRVLLRQADLPALLVSNLTNLRYLTGLTLSDGMLLVLPRAYIVFVDARYAEAARHTVLEGVEVQSDQDIARFLKRLPSCGFEEEDATVGRLSRWKKRFPGTKFQRTAGIVEEWRRQKDDVELQCLRRARRITREMLRRIPAALRTGATERGLAWKLRQWAQELGAEGLSFDPIVAFGTHSSRPHHHPTTRALQKGHVVQIDVGAVYKGYCGDLSEVFFTQKPGPREERAYRAVAEARDAVIDRIEEGASTRALDQLARTVLRRYEMEEYFTHALGHGVGLEVHEGPVLSSRAADRTLLAGEVITVEPGVYFPGKFGIRLEEMVVVPPKGETTKK